MDLKAGAGSPSAFAWAALLLAAFLAALTFVTFPRKPFVIHDEVSEKAVLSYAHQHKLQFGTDVVFTYGPLGFLVTRHYFPHAATLKMVVDLLLAFSVSTAICLIVWQIANSCPLGKVSTDPAGESPAMLTESRPKRLFSGTHLPLAWSCLLACTFIFVASNIDPRADLLIYVGLLCWALLCLVESGVGLPFSALNFIILAVFGVLVKANFLLIAGLTVVVIATDLWLRGRRTAALVLLPGFIATFALGWMASGQQPSHLGSFFANALSIIRGYDQVVTLDTLDTFEWRGLTTLVLAVAAILLRALSFAAWSKRAPSPREEGWGEGNGILRAESLQLLLVRRAVLLLWLAVFFFTVWKHAFVRADLFHMGFWFGFVPILMLALELLPSAHAKARLWARCLGAASCIVALATLQSLFLPSVSASLLQPFRAMSQNVAVLFRPADFESKGSAQYEAAVQATQLPKLRQLIGGSSVDVYGEDQCYAVFNGLDYHPRPVFQSYMAYNRPLARLNEQFYLSKLAPEYVLFKLDSVDRNLPPLQDAIVLRHLLLNYKPISAEGPFLLLRSNTCSSARLTLLHEQTASPSERISLANFGDSMTWLEIELQPSLAGRLRQIFYKPSKVRLALWSEKSKTLLVRMGAPAPMLAAGLLVSPLLLNNQDVLDFYAGKTTRPAACSIELAKGDQAFWNRRIRVRIYKSEPSSVARSGPISKGLNHSAQACEERATLGIHLGARDFARLGSNGLCESVSLPQ